MITVIVIIEVYKIKPLTKEAALHVASNLRVEDHREIVEGHGYHHLSAAIYPLSDDAISFVAPNGETAGMAGVGLDGAIWMLCTPAIHKYPLSFAKQAKQFVDSRTEPDLWNIVDSRNKAHLKLLKWLGFTFTDEFEYGPNNIPFIEFHKWQLEQSSV